MQPHISEEEESQRNACGGGGEAGSHVFGYLPLASKRPTCTCKLLHLFQL